MASVSQELPICSRLLSDDEVAHYLRLASMWSGLADRITDTRPSNADALDQYEQRQWMEEASRHREFQWSVIPGDRVWLTAGSPSHPEAEHGIPYLVVVRGTDVIIRYRLDGPAGPGLESPILASTKRLTRDEVIIIATGWVRARFPTVPVVARVQEFTDQTLDRLEQARGNEFSPSERHQLLNRWWVFFATTEDARGLGMPPSLRVVVDDVTGEADLAR